MTLWERQYEGPICGAGVSKKIEVFKVQTRLEKIATCYAKYIRRSSMIVPILGGVRHNMACAELSTSGPQNSQCTREVRLMSLVKLAQKDQQNETNKPKRSTKLGKLVKKGNRIRKSCKKMNKIG